MIDKNKYVDAILMDLSKVFDTINYKHLMSMDLVKKHLNQFLANYIIEYRELRSIKRLAHERIIMWCSTWFCVVANSF